MPASVDGRPDRALQEIDADAVKTIATWIEEGAHAD
jgi:hypothetical protein